MLDAPGAGREGLAEDLHVGDQAPVGDDDAVVAELLAQQAGDDPPVEAERDLLDRLAVQLEPDGMP